jgi:hypothetical protein
VNNFIKIPLLISVLSLGVAAGCGSDDDPSTDNGMVGGMATCDAESLLAAVSAGAPPNITYTVTADDPFECADGWAVLFPDEINADDPEMSFTFTAVLEAEGQFWIPKDRMDVCGTYDENDPFKRPDDAQVPAAIWDKACNTN